MEIDKELFMSKKKKLFIIGGVILAIFVIFTIIVKFVDVQNIGPNDTSVGLASINGLIHKRFKENHFFYLLTDYLGYITLLFCLLYVSRGLFLYNSFAKNSTKKINSEILWLWLFYVIVAGVYILFEKVIINYRPILIYGKLEASYPSSHTLLAVFVLGSSMIVSGKVFKEKFSYLLNYIAGVIMVVIVVGRLFSGVHWFTDIIGGVILSAGLLAIFTACITKEEKIVNVKQNQNND